jgi:hypothetical protein
LARRARKRREGAASHPPRPGASGARPSSRRATTSGAAAAGEPSGTTTADAPTGMARGRERDEAARAALVPLAPGERPWPIAVSAVLAALFAIANVILILTGWEVDGERPVAGGLVFSAVMLAAAVGIWWLRYWAVLGFEVLLGVTFIGALLSLLRAANAWAVVLAVVVMALTGPLFYLLIRQMARIQMPKRERFR